MSDLGMPRDLAHDWRNLADLVDAYAARQGVPCRDGSVPSDRWTSESKRDQAEAAIECRRCPALLACRQHGIAHPKEVGTYGGLTEDERRAAARREKERTRATS